MAFSEQKSWLDAAGRVPLLSAEQEIALARQVQGAAGIDPTTEHPEERRRLRRAQRARDHLCTANLRLVYRIANSYRPLVPDYQFQDLLQAGAMGTLYAAGRFDPTRGYKFSTYAAWWIRQHIQTEIDRHSRTIRPPTTITPKLRRLPAVRQRLSQQLNRSPTSEELADGLDISTQELSQALLMTRQPTSLDHAIGNDSETAIGEILAAPGDEPDLMLDELRETLYGLPRRQRLMIEAVYFPGTPSLSAMARAEGISVEQARKLLERGIARLRRLRPIPERDEHQLKLRLSQICIQPGAPQPRGRGRCNNHDKPDQLTLPLFHAKTLRKDTVQL